MRMTSEVETNIVAVERIKEYSEAVQVWSFYFNFLRNIDKKACLFFKLRKLRGIMENVNHLMHGPTRARFRLRNMKSAIEKDLTWSSKEFLVTLKVVKR